MSTLHKSADYHVSKLKMWTRNNDQVNASGDRQLGVDEALVLHFLNEGKTNLQRAVANARKDAFGAFVTKQITSRMKEFPIPEEAISDRIIRLDYAEANEDSKFYKLERRDITFWQYMEDKPGQYCQSGSVILPSPVPESGYYRFRVQRRDDTLDLRRGVVKPSGEVISGGNLQKIQLNTVTDAINLAELKLAEWVCVSDWEGEIKAYNIPISSFDASNYELIVRGAFPMTAGTIEEGDFVTIGKNTCTHSKLNLDYEDYYVEWTKLRLMGWDGMDQDFTGVGTIQTLRAEIIDATADTADLEEIPQVGQPDGNWFS